jgi:Ca2+-binding EF-hand superfamily protein
VKGFIMITEKGFDFVATSFDKADRDGDGYIDHKDFEAMVDSVCQAVGRDPRSPEAENVRFQYRQVADRLIERMDTNSDKQVSKQEYIAGARALQGDPAIVARNTAAASAMFNLVDTDGDGEISLDEYAKAMGAWGATKKQVEDDFRAFDKDKNGTVSLPELMERMQEIYGS